MPVTANTKASCIVCDFFFPAIQEVTDQYEAKKKLPDCDFNMFLPRRPHLYIPSQ